MTQQVMPALVSADEAMALELQPDNDPMAVVSGDPKASYRELYRDDVAECGVWEVTPGEFTGDNTGYSEHMYILAGDATVTSEDGSSVHLLPGVTFVARDGWRGSWQVRETVRKAYVIWKTA